MDREWYDAIQALNKERFWFLFWDFNLGRMWNFILRKDNIMPSFLEILITYVPLAAYSIWQTQRYVFAWREANTHYYLKRWERSTQTIEGASQRLQEDLMRFGTTLQSLFTGLFSAVLILFAFIPVLWTLSEGLPIWNGQIIPGLNETIIDYSTTIWVLAYGKQLSDYLLVIWQSSCLLTVTLRS